MNNNASEREPDRHRSPFGVCGSLRESAICDCANRVLYYAPQLVTENAASYSQRALAAGMFAAVFPARRRTSSPSGTAAAPAGALPLHHAFGYAGAGERHSRAAFLRFARPDQRAVIERSAERRNGDASGGSAFDFAGLRQPGVQPRVCRSRAVHAERFGRRAGGGVTISSTAPPILRLTRWLAAR